MTRIEEETGFTEDITDSTKRHYLVMRDIAESIYSPVGCLDSGMGVVFMYDKDTMSIILDGMHFKLEC